MKIHFLLLPLLFCLVILVIIPSVSSLVFNEIMYNPSGNDNNHEFVEVYSDDALDLSDFILGDLKSNDSIIPLLLAAASNYHIIVEEGFNYTSLSGLNCSIYTAGKSIGDDLDNSGDTIFMYYNNGSVVASLVYNNSLANGNGRSLELMNNTWQESLTEGGNPCQDNNFLPEPQPIIGDPILNQSNTSEINITLINVTLEFIIPDVIYTSVNYTSLFKIANFDYKQGDEAKNITFNYTINALGSQEHYREDSFVVSLKSTKRTELGYFFSQQAGNYLICGNINILANSIGTTSVICKEVHVLESASVACDVSITSFTDALNYTSGQKVGIFHRVTFKNDSFFPYTIEYLVEDVYGNIVKKSSQTTNTDKKSWTIPQRNELQIYFLISNLTVLCNNTNSLTNTRHLFYVKGERFEDSSLVIEEVYTPKDGIELGQYIKAKIHVYKGNTTRTSVHVYAASPKGKKISELIKLNFLEKYKETFFDISLKLSHDCSIEEGDYFFVAEGLGLNSRKLFTVTGKNRCNHLEELEKNDHDISIKSFYTRTKKIGEHLKLYATLDGNGTAILKLHGLNYQEQRSVDLQKEKTFTFLANTSEGNNLYLLQVIKNNKTVDIKELEIVKESSINHIEQKTPVQGYIQNRKYLQMLKEKIYEKGGTFVYASKNEQQRKFLPYFFAGFLIVLGIGAVFIWRSKTI